MCWSRWFKLSKFGPHSLTATHRSTRDATMRSQIGPSLFEHFRMNSYRLSLRTIHMGITEERIHSLPSVEFIVVVNKKKLSMRSTLLDWNKIKLNVSSEVIQIQMTIVHWHRRWKMILIWTATITRWIEAINAKACSRTMSRIWNRQ